MDNVINIEPSYPYKASVGTCHSHYHVAIGECEVTGFHGVGSEDDPLDAASTAGSIDIATNR